MEVQFGQVEPNTTPADIDLAPNAEKVRAATPWGDAALAFFSRATAAPIWFALGARPCAVPAAAGNWTGTRKSSGRIEFVHTKRLTHVRCIFCNLQQGQKMSLEVYRKIIFYYFLHSQNTLNWFPSEKMTFKWKPILFHKHAKLNKPPQFSILHWNMTFYNIIAKFYNTYLEQKFFFFKVWFHSLSSKKLPKLFQLNHVAQSYGMLITYNNSIQNILNIVKKHWYYQWVSINFYHCTKNKILSQVLYWFKMKCCWLKVFQTIKNK